MAYLYRNFQYFQIFIEILKNYNTTYGILGNFDIFRYFHENIKKKFEYYGRYFENSIFIYQPSLYGNFDGNIGIFSLCMYLGLDHQL